MLSEHINYVEALQKFRDREREYQKRRRVCQCLDHRPLRKYIGVWMCVLCLRPRERPING